MQQCFDPFALMRRPDSFHSCARLYRLGNVLDVSVAAGAAGELQMSTNLNLSHDRRRKEHSALHGSERVVAVEGGPSVSEQLRAILHANAVRVIDVFRDWDDDQTGTIDADEFSRAFAALGYDAPAKEIAALFAEYDTDGSGTIECSLRDTRPAAWSDACSFARRT